MRQTRHYRDILHIPQRFCGQASEIYLLFFIGTHTNRPFHPFVLALLPERAQTKDTKLVRTNQERPLPNQSLTVVTRSAETQLRTCGRDRGNASRARRLGSRFQLTPFAAAESI